MKRLATILKGRGELNWVYFIELDDKSKMSIIGLVGYCRRYDGTYPKERAREIYRELIKEGWKKVDPKKAFLKMPLHRLKMWIYD